jgi:acyl carrier protein
MTGLRERIIRATVEHANLDPAKVNDATLISALGINSLSLMHLITMIEDGEGISLDDDAFYQIFAAARLGEIVQVFDRFVPSRLS